MMRLTPQERKAVCLVLFLLLVGWAVKALRLAHSDRPGPETTSGPLAVAVGPPEHARH